MRIGCIARPVGVGEAGEASASPLFSHQLQIKYTVQYSGSLRSYAHSDILTHALILKLYSNFLKFVGAGGGGGGGGLGGYMSSNPVEPPHYDFPSYGPDHS